MLSTALVIFREAFEIALILGVVLAATRGLVGRGRYVWGGFAAGAAGAGLLAFFMGAISSGFEGMGQEILNASILFTAAFFIGWTVIWMRTHAREMITKMKSVSLAVCENQVPCIALSLVIGLAVLREGAEIALFTGSMLATGKAVADVALGSLLGAVAGFGLGALLYFGLIRIPTQHLMTVTSALLTLVVCGLMAVGTGYLVQAGYFFDYSDIVWDTSGILAESSLAGQTLHVLVGYIQQPMEIQLMAYTLTLFTLVALMWLMARPKKGSLAPVAVLALALLAFAPEAQATKQVKSPYVEAGEMEFELKGGHVVDDDAEVDGARKAKLGLGYGMNDFWFSEVEFEIEREGEGGAEYKSTAVEWENKFMLTQPGEYEVDVGLYLAYEATLESAHPDKVEGMLLLARDTGRFSHLANLILEKQVGGYVTESVEGGAALSSRYRWMPEFEPGAEWYMEFGELGNIHAEHQAGPVAYGEIPGTHLGYDLGYLFGVSDSAPDGEAKLILEYGFRF